ncbi:MAG: hypothetical protein U9O86_07070 [Campylobacterota bacterium]|nr:hypothetical protein [Campylobacterota bacterium]
MTNTLFMDKYPTYSLEIKKNETNYKNVDEIINYFKALIAKHPIATFISVFDHYSHTESLKEGELLDGLTDAKNLIFCFGKQIPTTKILAVRPRSISISLLNDTFVIDFLEVPNEQLQQLVYKWVESVKNK